MKIASLITSPMLQWHNWTFLEIYENSQFIQAFSNIFFFNLASFFSTSNKFYTECISVLDNNDVKVKLIYRPQSWLYLSFRAASHPCRDRCSVTEVTKIHVQFLFRLNRFIFGNKHRPTKKFCRRASISFISYKSSYFFLFPSFATQPMLHPKQQNSFVPRDWRFTRYNAHSEKSKAG